METRNDSPFPTKQCSDSNCNSSVPKSTGRDYCTSCQNFKQIFGENPSDVSNVSVTLEQKHWGYDMFFWIDGDKIKRGSFSNEDHAKRRKREYESAAIAVGRAD